MSNSRRIRGFVLNVKSAGPAFACAALCFQLQVRTFARDPLVRVEPPSPSFEAPWQQIHADQLSTADRLRDFGVSLEYQRKENIQIENTPDYLRFDVSLEADKLKVWLGVRTPDNSVESGSFMSQIVFSEEGMSTETKAEYEVNGQKFGGEMLSDPGRGLQWSSLSYEFSRAFAALKVGLKPGAGGVSLSHSVEFSLAKLCNLVRGIEGRTDLQYDIKIKIDTDKFARQVVREAPQFIRFANQTAADAANTVRMQFNPLLLVAAISNDASLWSRQKALVEVRKSLGNELPKGVKIQYNNSLLAEMLRKGSSDNDRDALRQLADALENTAESAKRAKLISNYIRRLKANFGASKQTRTAKDVRLVSLRELVTSAEAYASNWDELPPELLAPGGISRVVGFTLDSSSDDVLLIGEVVPGAPRLSIDDLVAAVRSVWKENATPFCSLDPDPENIGGDQRVRVSGVPADSGFALAMLEADYLMKRMIADQVKVESPGYVSYIDLVRNVIRKKKDRESANRYWLCPCPLQTGDIVISPDGRVVIFNSGIQVLSEQMMISHDGLVGAGHVDETADRWAAGLTQALPDLERRYPEYQHLHGLFDLVLLSKTWQKIGSDSQWIARLAALPCRKVSVPTTYKGITVERTLDQAGTITCVFRGGVRVRTAASPRAIIVTDQPGFAAVRSSVRDGATRISRPVQGGELVLPAGSHRQQFTIDVATILALMRQGEETKASAGIQKLITADPFDPEPWCLRAMVHIQSRAYGAALADANHAIELDPDDPDNLLTASAISSNAHFLTGRAEESIADMDRALRVLPDSSRAHILKGDALAELDRTEEARASYKNALQIDPQSVQANVSLALLDLSDGRVVTARKLIRKARAQTKLEGDLPAVIAAMALAEIGVAVLGDADSHFATAGDYAAKVLADPAADPLSRVRCLLVQAVIALSRDDIQAADGYVQKATKLVPMNPMPLLMLASWMHDQKKDDAARRYLEQAARIAPDHPEIGKLRTLLKDSP